MKLAIGTAQFGLDYGIANAAGQVPLAEASSILGHARQHGIDTLDTAALYGDSEHRLGQIGVVGWQVISKLPAVPTECADVVRWVFESVSASLSTLGIDQLSALLLHRPAVLLSKGGQQLYEALLALKAAGQVQRIGVSIYDPSELDGLRDFQLDLVQAPFNVFDRRLLATGWMSQLAARGTEVHVRSVFLQGLLLMSAASRPRGFGRWEALWQRYDRWLADERVTALEACIRHALAFPEISRVVIGVDSVGQLAAILDAATGLAEPAPADLSSTDVELLEPWRWSTFA